MGRGAAPQGAVPAPADRSQGARAAEVVVGIVVVDLNIDLTDLVSFNSQGLFLFSRFFFLLLFRLLALVPKGGRRSG